MGNFDLCFGGVGKIESLVSGFKRFTIFFSGAEVVNYGFEFRNSTFPICLLEILSLGKFLISKLKIKSSQTRNFECLKSNFRVPKLKNANFKFPDLFLDQQWV